MRLSKAQVEAIVEEVNDQINKATQNQLHLFKGKADWEKLQLVIKDYQAIEKKLNKAREVVDDLETEYSEFEDKVKEKVKQFEKKHGTDVEWEYLDEDEDPKFTLKTKDLSAQIERTITLMSIDTKEKITSDMLIERMVEKFSKI